MPSHAYKTLLISCYELGHQPLSLAWPAACLRRAGLEIAVLDLAVEPFDSAAAISADFVGIAVPMHTALRMGVQAAEAVREVNQAAHLCFFGLYAWLNRQHLLDHFGCSVIGGEVEGPLVQLAVALSRGQSPEGIHGVARPLGDSVAYRGRVSLPVPERDALPALVRYAHYVNGGAPKLAGYVEATRGCLHTCRHCPVVPIYQGRFFAVPADVVLADIRQQVAAGAAHITFGDPDFLNGPGHALKLARALQAEFPGVTFDFTTKVEHIRQHHTLFPELRALGCRFVTTAIESLSDRVLAALDKGHSAADIDQALTILEDAGLAMRPTLLAFTPWTTVDDYVTQVDFIHHKGLHAHIAPVQLSIRLLLPPHSKLLDAPDADLWLGELDPANFSYRWTHPDPRMDRLHVEVSACVRSALAASEPPAATHAAIRQLAYSTAGRGAPPVAELALSAGHRTVPRLTENWFC